MTTPNRPEPIEAGDYEAALRLLEGELDDAGMDEMNRRAVDDPALAQLLFTLAEQRWTLSESLARSTRVHEFTEAVKTQPTLAVARPVARISGWRMRWAAGLLIAASIGIVVMIASSTERPTTPKTAARQSESVASVVALRGVGYAQSGQTLAEGADVSAGTVQVESGAVELITSRGVHLTLLGPGEYDLADGLHASVQYGNLAAAVPHYIDGYTVTAGRVRVVDLGTEFSVDRRADGRVRVDVYTGRVRATEFDLAGRPINTHLITAAHARLFSDDGASASVEAPARNTPLAAGDPGISDNDRPNDSIVIDPLALTPYSNQDGLKGHPTRAEVADNGHTITLIGNAWKALPLNYDVTEHTVLEFEYRIRRAAEVIGIGLDDDNQHATPHALFALAGVENQLPYFDYQHWTQPTDAWRTVRIRFGDETPFKARQLVLFADDDRSGAAEASFRNIRLYRDTNPEISD